MSETAKMPEHVLLATDPRGVATVTLNRPEKHNAFDEQFIATLTVAFRKLGADSKLRAVVLRANGRNFCAGADVDWMKRMAGHGPAENLRDAEAMAEMFRTVDAMPVPVIARVQGAALGGGCGLICLCDIALASTDATFAFSEVRLGIIPATIGPYVLRTIGTRAARRWLLTGERFGAPRAREIGLVHEVLDESGLDDAVNSVLDGILKSGPGAVRATKQLIRDLAGRAITDDLVAMTCRRIAEIRASDEGREGLSAFLEKRLPAWTKGD
jgi:methylglutaconyl-CoA hydratase